MVDLKIDHHDIDGKNFETVEKLVQKLQQGHSSVATLKLNNLFLPDDDMNRLFATLETVLQNTLTLIKLDLVNSLSRVSDAMHVFRGLWGNRTLTSLNLSENSYCLCDAHLDLADVLRNNKTLRSLSLRDCHIRDNHLAPIISAAALENRTIENLDIENNDIGPQCSSCLKRVLVSNTSITSLDLGRGRIEESDLGIILMGLCQNRTLKRLSLAYNIMNANHVEMLVSTIVEHQVIEFLDLRFCYIDEYTIARVADMIYQNPKLEKISLYGNEIGYRGASIVAVAIIKRHRHKLFEMGAKSIFMQYIESEFYKIGILVDVNFDDALRTVLQGEKETCLGKSV